VTTGRFAPTPSGDLHLGNLRTALLAWCFARHAGGRFLLRVEDLTTGAAPRRSAEQLEDLAAIGIDHDGAVVAQSERRHLYDAAIEQLELTGATYPCYCSRRDIREAAAAPHGPLPEGAYPGTCWRLTPAERDRRSAGGRPPALRLRADAVEVDVHDRLLGTWRAPVDDFVIRRADGVPAYNLAVVVDDADQGVDQVVRGADLADTTPRQVLVQRLLGLPTPEYLHVPLVLGSDGERLAKRHGAISLRQRRALGESVEQVVGRMAASMGLADTGERLSASMLLERFDPSVLRIVDTLPD
jgi:glutamyl-tRNA synthetase